MFPVRSLQQGFRLADLRISVKDYSRNPTAGDAVGKGTAGQATLRRTTRWKVVLSDALDIRILC
jgi:hypothetical protein